MRTMCLSLRSDDVKALSPTRHVLTRENVSFDLGLDLPSRQVPPTSILKYRVCLGCVLSRTFEFLFVRLSAILCPGDDRGISYPFSQSMPLGSDLIQ